MQEVAERHCLRPEDSDATPSLNTRAQSGNSSLKAPSGEREAEALRCQCAEESCGCVLHIQVPGGLTWGAWWAPAPAQTRTPAYCGAADPHPTCQSIPSPGCLWLCVSPSVLAKPTWTERNAAISQSTGMNTLSDSRQHDLSLNPLPSFLWLVLSNGGPLGTLSLGQQSLEDH